MKTIEKVTLYKCDFCKKELKRKHAMANHELKCNSNPINNKACHFCEHLETIEKDVWFENRYYHPDYSNSTEGDYRKVKVFRCKKLDKLMYPFSIEKRNIVEEYPSTFEDQEPMPKECEDFNDQFNF